jgi:hypothetical protein
MSIDQVAIDNLIEIARLRGRVSTDDIRHAVPIDEMDAADIADIIVRLEDAGVSVDIDPSLLSPKHHTPMTTPKPIVDQSQKPRLRAGSQFRVSSTSSRSGSSATPRSDLAPASTMSGSAAPAKGRIPRNLLSWLGIALVGAVLFAVIVRFVYR